MVESCCVTCTSLMSIAEYYMKYCPCARTFSSQHADTFRSSEELQRTASELCVEAISYETIIWLLRISWNITRLSFEWYRDEDVHFIMDFCSSELNIIHFYDEQMEYECLAYLYRDRMRVKPFHMDSGFTEVLVLASHSILLPGFCEWTAGHF